MAAHAFTYRGFECIKNYMGHYGIYPAGEISSIKLSPSEDDAKRWIDKYWKERGK